MNSARILLQHNKRVQHLFLSMIQPRNAVMVHTGIFERFGPSPRDTRQSPLKINLPVTWSVCNYAKKAGSDKKGKVKKVAKVELSPEEMGDIIDIEKVKDSMQEALNKLKENYMHNLNIRTNLGSFDRIVVDTDDGKFNLNQLGQIVQKNPQLLMINLSAVPQYIKLAKKALENSGLNINPQQEGTTLYVAIPKVTREHRENLAKNAKSLFVQTKTQLATLHNKHSKKVNSAKGKHSADLVRSIHNLLLDIMHEYTAEAEKMMEVKQKELLGS